jgi:hypothetical protein
MATRHIDSPRPGGRVQAKTVSVSLLARPADDFGPPEDPADDLGQAAAEGGSA